MSEVIICLKYYILFKCKVKMWNANKQNLFYQQRIFKNILKYDGLSMKTKKNINLVSTSISWKSKTKLKYLRKNSIIKKKEEYL